MKVLGLFRDWPIELDLRWIVGTKGLDMMQVGDSHATKPPVIVNSAREAGRTWTRLVGDIHLPGVSKAQVHLEGKTVTVKDAEEEAALGAGWADSRVRTVSRAEVRKETRAGRD